jgi:hypothetical protein
LFSLSFDEANNEEVPILLVVLVGIITKLDTPNDGDDENDEDEDDNDKSNKEAITMTMTTTAESIRSVLLAADDGIIDTESGILYFKN